MGSSSRPGDNCTSAHLTAQDWQNEWSKQCDTCLLSPFVCRRAVRGNARSKLLLCVHLFHELTWLLNFEVLFFACTPIEVLCVPCMSGFPSMLVPVISTPGVRASRATGTKRRKLGGFGHSALKCTLSRSSIWELRGDMPRWNEESPLASTKNAPIGRHKIAKRRGTTENYTNRDRACQGD